MDRNEEWKQRLIGKTLLKDNASTALADDEIVRMSDLPEPHRVLPPGMPQTRDFRPDRLNVFVDDDYKINQVYFG